MTAFTFSLFLFFLFLAHALLCTYPLSLHDALPISVVRRQENPPPRRAGFGRAAPCRRRAGTVAAAPARAFAAQIGRHTSELQSPCNLVCRLLLEKKKKKKQLNTEHKQKQSNKTRHQ